jgi:hypothetical protein
MVISWAWAILDDKARKPESEPKPKRAVLDEATVYVTGNDGGTFNLAWEVRPPERFKGEKDRIAFPVVSDWCQESVLYPSPGPLRPMGEYEGRRPTRNRSSSRSTKPC